MDSLLIDFSSPKLKQEDAPLIPQSLLAPMLKSCAPYSMDVGDSNPFDQLICQVAANSAAENDPFEMVLNDAMNCQVVRKEDSAEESPRLTQLSVGRKSLSLPDLRHVLDQEVFSPSLKSNESCCANKNQFSPDKTSSCCAPSQNRDHVNVPASGNTDSTEWNYLDDIPPPDSLLNSTADMSCFLDETLPTTVSSKLSMKLTASPDVAEQSTNTDSALPGNPKLKEFLKATYKSEEELRMFAQKKIENIITKAKLEVRNDIQDSIIQRRLSTQGPSFPNQEALALCTPNRSRDVHAKPTKEISWSLKEWSQNEMINLNLIFPESKPKHRNALGSLLMPDLDKVDITTLFATQTNISFEEMPTEDLSLSSPLFQMPSKEKSPKGGNFSAETPKKSLSVQSSSSPILLPIPLCEDAVRTLSLCSKYSPPPPHTSSQRKDEGNLPSVNAISNPEKNTRQAKLLLRKPIVPSKTTSKMAPMKATAPVQNMTRTKTSLAPSTKLEMNCSSASALRQLVAKDPCSKPTSENTRRFLRLPQSPSRIVSGSVPNLPSQGNKLPSRLPSPRRSSVSTQEPKILKNQPESEKERILGSSFHSSPRPVRKGSLQSRSGNHSRVLADVNSCLSGRVTPKRRIAGNQLGTPRRGRSILSEKENLL